MGFVDEFNLVKQNKEYVIKLIDGIPFEFADLNGEWCNTSDYDSIDIYKNVLCSPDYKCRDIVANHQEAMA